MTQSDKHVLDGQKIPASLPNTFISFLKGRDAILCSHLPCQCLFLEKPQDQSKFNRGGQGPSEEYDLLVSARKLLLAKWPVSALISAITRGTSLKVEQDKFFRALHLCALRSYNMMEIEGPVGNT
jgi:hypothetical protein